MSELILALGLAGFAAPAEVPDLTRIWERETFLGEVAQAAQEYKRIYQDELRDLPLEVRRRAAYRAGLCFERVGQPENARYAYGWLSESGRRGAAARLEVSEPGGDVLLVARARERLRDLSQRVEASPGGDASTRQAVELWERELVEVNDELGAVIRALEDSAAVVSRVDAALRELKRRYMALGMQLGPRTGPRFRESERRSLGVRLEALFRDGTLPERIGDYATRDLLAWHWLREALLSTTAGRSAEAEVAWRLCGWAVKAPPFHIDGLLPEQLDGVRDRLQDLSGQTLQAAAERELLDWHLEAWTKVEYRLLQRLRDARRTAGGRPLSDLPLHRYLFDIPEFLDGVLPAVLKEPQVEALQREAQELIFLLGQGAIAEERLADLWRERRRLRDAVLLAVASRLEFVFHELSEVVVEPQGVDVDLIDLGGRELKRQARRVVASLEQSDLDEADVQLQVLQQLRGWFPVADAEENFQGETSRLLRQLAELEDKSPEEAPTKN